MICILEARILEFHRAHLTIPTKDIKKSLTVLRFYNEGLAFLFFLMVTVGISRHLDSGNELTL